MKLFNYIKLAALGLVASAMAVSCQEEVGLANAVLPEENNLTFAAVSAEPQTLWVYADGEWIAECDAEWLTIEPAFGCGNTEVVLTVSDNVKNGAQDAPRSTVIYFRGRSTKNFGQTNIAQKGDTYLGSPEIEVSGIASLDNNAVAKVLNSTVMAVSSKGFVASDGKAAVYVMGTADVAVGDKVYFNGTKITNNGVPAFKLDECEVQSKGSASYPDAKDVTSSADTYAATATEFVTISGSLVNSDVRISGATARFMAIDVPESVALAEANLHKVTLTGYYAGKAGGKLTIVVVDLKVGDADESLVPYPIKWVLGAADYNNFNASWIDVYANDSEGNLIRTKAEEDMYVESLQGLGYITYIGNPDFTEDNSAAKIYPHRDVNANHPRITGAWTGDYWLFRGLGAIKAGSQVQITFEARVSATNPKYWEIQYCDGGVWKTAGELKTISEPDGRKTTYTHEMNADGATNVQVQETVKFNKNNSECHFRFLCKTNLQANGTSYLTVRNGGSARIAVTDASNEAWQPSIVIVSEGDGVEREDTPAVEAKIEVSEDVLAFEGAPAAPKNLVITSDHAFEVSTDAEWLSFDKTGGAAGEKTTIAVTCEASTLTTLRQAQIKISSESSKYIVNVVQSAAGGDVDPLISFVGSNVLDVEGVPGTVTVKVQSNVELDVTPAVDWITYVPATKAMITTGEYAFSLKANTTGAARTGTVLFEAKDKSVKAVLVVNQALFVAQVKAESRASFTSLAGLRVIPAEPSVDFNIAASESWVSVASSGKAGDKSINVTLAANTTGAERTATLTFTNAEYDFTETYTIVQKKDVFADDFSWLSPMIAAYNEANPTNTIGDYGNCATADWSAAVTDRTKGGLQNAPNAYSAEPFKSYFPAALAAAGYTDMNASAKVLYPQDAYIKQGKTSAHTSLQFQPVDVDAPTDINLSWDWVCQIQGSGKIDPVKLTVVIVGDGTFENGTKYSDDVLCSQKTPSDMDLPSGVTAGTLDDETGLEVQYYEIKWTRSTVKIKGATSNTKLNIVYTKCLDKTTGKYNWTASGARRWHMDNLLVEAAN